MEAETLNGPVRTSSGTTRLWLTAATRLPVGVCDTNGGDVGWGWSLRSLVVYITAR